MTGIVISTPIARMSNNYQLSINSNNENNAENPEAKRSGNPTPVNRVNFSKGPRPVIKSVRVSYATGNQKTALKSARELNLLRFEIKGTNLPTEALTLEIPNIKNLKLIAASATEIVFEGRAGEKDRLQYRRVKLLSEGKIVAEKTIALTLTVLPKCPPTPSAQSLREHGLCK